MVARFLQHLRPIKTAQSHDSEFLLHRLIFPENADNQVKWVFGDDWYLLRDGGQFSVVFAAGDQDEIVSTESSVTLAITKAIEACENGVLPDGYYHDQDGGWLVDFMGRRKWLVQNRDQTLSFSWSEWLREKRKDRNLTVWKDANNSKFAVYSSRGQGSNASMLSGAFDTPKQAVDDFVQKLKANWPRSKPSAPVRSNPDPKMREILDRLRPNPKQKFFSTWYDGLQKEAQTPTRTYPYLLGRQVGHGDDAQVASIASGIGIDGVPAGGFLSDLPYYLKVWAPQRFSRLHFDGRSDWQTGITAGDTDEDVMRAYRLVPVPEAQARRWAPFSVRQVNGEYEVVYLPPGERPEYISSHQIQQEAIDLARNLNLRNHMNMFSCLDHGTYGGLNEGCPYCISEQPDDGQNNGPVVICDMYPEIEGGRFGLFDTATNRRVLAPDGSEARFHSIQFAVDERNRRNGVTEGVNPNQPNDTASAPQSIDSETPEPRPEESKPVFHRTRPNPVVDDLLRKMRPGRTPKFFSTNNWYRIAQGQPEFNESRSADQPSADQPPSPPAPLAPVEQESVNTSYPHLLGMAEPDGGVSPFPPNVSINRGARVSDSNTPYYILVIDDDIFMLLHRDGMTIHNTGIPYGMLEDVLVRLYGLRQVPDSVAREWLNANDEFRHSQAEQAAEQPSPITEVERVFGEGWEIHQEGNEFVVVNPWVDEDQAVGSGATQHEAMLNAVNTLNTEKGIALPLGYHWQSSNVLTSIGRTTKWEPVSANSAMILAWEEMLQHEFQNPNLRIAAFNNGGGRRFFVRDDKKMLSSPFPTVAACVEAYRFGDVNYPEQDPKALLADSQTELARVMGSGFEMRLTQDVSGGPVYQIGHLRATAAEIMATSSSPILAMEQAISHYNRKVRVDLPPGYYFHFFTTRRARSLWISDSGEMEDSEAAVLWAWTDWLQMQTANYHLVIKKFMNRLSAFEFSIADTATNMVAVTGNTPGEAVATYLLNHPASSEKRFLHADHSLLNRVVEKTVLQKPKPNPLLNDVLRRLRPGKPPQKTFSDSGWYRTAGEECWGAAGSGILYVCLQDQTMLLVKRSMEVMDPGTWGIPGGALKGTEGYFDADDVEHEHDDCEARGSAETEVSEELGVLPRATQKVGETVFHKGNFRFTTYVLAMDFQEKNRIQSQVVLNWENDDWGWFPIASPPTPLHPGVQYTLGQVQWPKVPPATPSARVRPPRHRR